MGRKFASIWIPMRAALGMAVLVPTPASGYSIIQVFVMWLILQGVGAADKIWNGILGDLSNGLGATRGITKKERALQVAEPGTAPLYERLRTEGENLTNSVLRSSICAQALQKISANPAAFRSPASSLAVQHGRNVKMYSTTANIVADADEAVVFGTIFVGVPGNEQFNDICGKYDVVGSVDRAEWDEPDQVTEQELRKKARLIYQHKVNALQAMFHELNILAKTIVDENASPRGLHDRLAALDDKPVEPSGYRDRAINIYVNEMAGLINPRRVEAIDDIVREGVLSGWIAAGSFYFALNKTYDVEFYHSITQAPVATLIPHCNNADNCMVFFPAHGNELNAKIRNVLQYDSEKNLIATRLWDAKIYLDEDRASSVGRLEIDSSVVEPANARMHELQKRVAIDMAKMMSERAPDPIIAQGKFGASIMATTEDLWMDTLTEQQLHTLLLAEGTLENTEGVRQHLQNLTQSGAFFMSIYGFLWVIGATLAIYIPLIPYMMFAVGILGWFLLVIEAVVAAPILALSFILPSGEELGKIMQGLMLLMNIILRPALMLFGFVLASRLYGVIVEFVNFSMIGNFANLDTASSMFAWVGILTLYAAFIIALANKCFALIYALPDKILRWMGGAPEHTDASQELGQAKGALGKGADTVNKISTGFAEKGFMQLQNRAKQNNPPDDVRGGGDRN